MDLNKLEQLVELLESGLLSPEEFEIEKAKILNFSDNKKLDENTNTSTDTFEDDSIPYEHGEGFEKSNNHRFFIILGVAIAIIIATALAYTLLKTNESESGYVFAEVLNCRSEPNVKSEVITTLKQDLEVNILETIGDWAKVKTEDAECWVSKEYISKYKSNVFGINDETSDKAKKLKEFPIAFQGMWGVDSDQCNSIGFDGPMGIETNEFFYEEVTSTILSLTSNTQSNSISIKYKAFQHGAETSLGNFAETWTLKKNNKELIRDNDTIFFKCSEFPNIPDNNTDIILDTDNYDLANELGVNITDMEYSILRPLLIKANFIPVTPDNRLSLCSEEPDNYECEYKYKETETCSGTGSAYCIFLWSKSSESFTLHTSHGDGGYEHGGIFVNMSYNR